VWALAQEGGVLQGAARKADASAKTKPSDQAADRPKLAGASGRVGSRLGLGKPTVHQRMSLPHRKEGAGTRASQGGQGASPQDSLAASFAEELEALEAASGDLKGPGMLGRGTIAGMKKRRREGDPPGASGKGKAQGGDRKGAEADGVQPKTRGKVGPIHALSHDILALPEHLLGGFLSARPS